MISRIADWFVASVSPNAGVRRAHARKVLRGFYGAESNRLTAQSNPRNRSADAESQGPFGADSLRAWSRQLVRDNAYAWGVVDTIVTNVVGCGIGMQSAVRAEDEDNPDNVLAADLLNDRRDKIWSEWCEVCDINGQLSFDEIQSLAWKEIVEAGEVLIHYINVPKKHNGIHRPVPLAIEVIEADRIAVEYDTVRMNRDSGNQIIRGVEMDDKGRPVAYWVYPEHPQGVTFTTRQEPVRLPAANVEHLFRRERIGQSRGCSWFAPVLSVLRDLGTYVDNELQASAVASCFVAAIKTEGGYLDLGNPPTTTAGTVDEDSNRYGYIQPGMFTQLRTGEDITFGNPGRPNAQAEPWLNLMLRGIAVGTGLSYETVSRDYSQTNYSSNRASQQEDRRRFRRWQRMSINHLNLPTWDRFCDAAARDGNESFPTASELLEDRREFAAVEPMPPTWEWVDPVAEQQSSQNAIDSWQASYEDEMGAQGKNYRRVFRKRAKEEALKKRLRTRYGLDSLAGEEPDMETTEKHEEVSSDTQKV